LNFATDAWSSPNHKVYVAITVHFTHKGAPVSMLLDLVEVAKSHSGANLAAAFAEVLEDFGISDKVRLMFFKKEIIRSFFLPRSSASPLTMHRTTIR
jgi:hypothetical protein